MEFTCGDILVTVQMYYSYCGSSDQNQCLDYILIVLLVANTVTSYEPSNFDLTVHLQSMVCGDIVFIVTDMESC